MASTRFTAASSEYSYTTSSPPGDVDYSAGGWVRFASRANGMACFSIGPASGDFPGSYDVIHLMGGSADYWGLTCGVAYAEDNAFYGPSAVASDTWYHVMLVADGSTTLLYIDGVQRVSVSHTRTSRVDAGHLRLGSSTVSWFTSLDGEMAGWNVWDRALTAGQVAAQAWSYMPVTTQNLRAAWPLLAGSRTAEWGGLGLTLTEVNTPTDGTATPPPIAFRRHVFTGVPAAAAGGGTGELAATISTTISATGVLPILGTASPSVSATVSATGVLPILGTASPSVSATVTSTGVLPIVGTASPSVSATLSATGVLPILGELAATIETTVSASSSAAITGASATTVDTTLSATGTLLIQGTASASVDTTLSATGTSALVGQLSATVSTTLSATGTLSITGGLSSTITTTLVATAATPRSGSASVSVSTTLSATATGAGVSWQVPIFQAIRDRLDAALAVPITYDNGPAPTLVASWARATIFAESIQVATMDGYHYRQRVALVVNAFAPRALGDVTALAVGQSVIDSFRRWRNAEPPITCTAVSFVGGVEPSEAWSGRTVRASFAVDLL